MASVINISGLSKTYKGGLQALKTVDLEIEKGEIFALLGPNGAGKTTLISIVCGIVTPTTGTVTVDGHDIIRDYRAARQQDRPGAAGAAHRRLRERDRHGDLQPRPVRLPAQSRPIVEKILKELSLWDKRKAKIMELSGGMKRRVMIAKALSHEPEILFLDEPTAGVDVELRRDMWNLVRQLRESGVTIILTTHYIEEAEEMADRVGRDQQGRADPGRGEDQPDEEARQEGADPEPQRGDGGDPARARRVEPDPPGRGPRAAHTCSTPTPSAPASPRFCAG